MKKLAAILAFIAVLFACAGDVLAADWTRVQGASAQNTAASTVAFSSPVTSGNTVVGAALVSTTAGGVVIPIVNVTDDKGNVYLTTYVAPSSATNNTAVQFVSDGPITNGPQTITVQISGTPNAFFFKEIDEFAPPTGSVGIYQDCVSAMSSFNGGTTSLQFQTTVSDVLIWSWSIAGGTTPGAGFTAGIVDNPNTVFSEFKIQAAASNTNTALWGAAVADGGLMCIAPIANAHIAYRQNAHAPTTAGSVTTLGATFTKPIQAGSFVVGGMGANSQTVTSISDDKANSYSFIVTNAALGHGIFWSNGPLNNGPSTVTINSSVAAQMAISMSEFAPPARNGVALDSSVDGSHSGTAVTTLNAAVATAKNNEIVYSWISSGATVGDLVQNGWSAVNNVNIKNSDAFWTQATAGTATATWNFGSSTGIALFVASFQAVPPTGSVRVGSDGVAGNKVVGGLFGGIAN